MVKRIVTALVALVVGFCCCAPVVASPEEKPFLSVSAHSAVLIESESGTVFFEKNAHFPMGMASTTKIMTALVALEHCAPETSLRIPPEAVGVEGSSVYLVEGETLTLRELLYALLLSSANDAACAIAICVGGSEEGFCALMNQKAEALGLQSTRFENPHGLYHEEHYTTAYELALIAREALRHPLLREIVSTYKATIPHDGTPNARLLVNHNKLLRSYEGAIGVKTGFTKKTGRTLVSAAEREGMTLIAVTLNAPDDWRDHTAMLDYGFSAYRAVTFAEVGEFSYSLPLTGGTKETVTLINTEPLRLILPKNHANPTYLVEGTHRFLFAPVKKGVLCGRVTLRVGDQTVSSPLCLAEDCERRGEAKKTAS